MSDPFREALDEATGEFADTWKPDPGDRLVGQIVRYERATTRYGPCDVAVVIDEDTGQEWGVWLLEFVLQRKFHDLRPRIGERVGIKYVGKVDREGDNPYKNFVVQVDRKAGDDASVPRFVDEEYPPGHPAGPPPAPAPHPHAAPPPTAPPAAHAPPPARSPHEESPAERFRRLQDEWNTWCRKHRVEPWAIEALARAHRGLDDDLRLWSEDDYQTAIAVVRQHNTSVFDRAGKKLAEQEPADPELLEHVKNSLEQLAPKARLRVQEAIDSGWHDAIVWADELVRTELTPSEGSPAPASPPPDLSEPEDDLPF